MLGNCATGKVRTVSEPTNTMTIEITMATIGRLMKNFDMDHVSLSIHRCFVYRSLLIDPYSSILGFCYKRLGVHAHTGAHPLNAFNYDSVACIEAARHDQSVIDAVAHRNGSNINFIAGAHDSNLVAALQFRYRALWNK